MTSRSTNAALLLTVDEFSDYLKVSRSTVYRLLKRNQLPPVKIGNDLRFDLEEIERIGHPAFQLRTLAGRLGQYAQFHSTAVFASFITHRSCLPAG